MPSLADTDPKRFIAGFFTSFTEELLRSDEDAGRVIDRFHTPDVVQVADGHRIDREKLIAHARPVRRNRPVLHVHVHEALANGEHLAARYTMHVRDRRRTLAIDVHFFGEFGPDGRMRRADMLTRRLDEAGGAAAAG